MLHKRDLLSLLMRLVGIEYEIAAPCPGILCLTFPFSPCCFDSIRHKPTGNERKVISVCPFFFGQDLSLSLLNFSVYFSTFKLYYGHLEKHYMYLLIICQCGKMTSPELIIILQHQDPSSGHDASVLQSSAVNKLTC